MIGRKISLIRKTPLLSHKVNKMYFKLSSIYHDPLEQDKMHSLKSIRQYIIVVKTKECRILLRFVTKSSLLPLIYSRVEGYSARIFAGFNERKRCLSELLAEEKYIYQSFIYDRRFSLVRLLLAASVWFRPEV